MSDKEFIKQFRKINIINICKKINVNYYNIMSERSGYSTTKKVANELEKQIKELLDKRQK